MCARAFNPCQCTLPIGQYCESHRYLASPPSRTVCFRLSSHSRAPLPAPSLAPDACPLGVVAPVAGDCPYLQDHPSLQARRVGRGGVRWFHRPSCPAAPTPGQRPRAHHHGVQPLVRRHPAPRLGLHHRHQRDPSEVGAPASVGVLVYVHVNELRLGFSNTTRNPEGINCYLSHYDRKS
jgi:hypothetical protein